MAESLKVIPIGKNNNATYCGYGDDSARGETLVFAMALMERSKVNMAKNILNEIKDKYKIPHTIPLHCRVLFSGDQRRKQGLAHLDVDDVYSCFHDVLNKMKLLRVLCRFSYATRPAIPTLTEKDEAFPLTILNRDKMIQGILAQACIHMGPGYPSPENLECWFSEDTTLTEVALEVPRQQAQKGYQGFSEIGTPSGSHNRFEPHVVRWADEPMLQLADIYAYLAANAMEEKRANAPGYFYNSLHSIYWASELMSFNLDEAPKKEGVQ